MSLNFNKFINALKRGLERSARSRVRQSLLRYDDRLLSDAGFSRELLESGVDAWPWRKPEERSHGTVQAATANAITTRQQDEKTTQVQTSSDTPLADAGITRSEVEDSVVDERTDSKQSQRHAA